MRTSISADKKSKQAFDHAQRLMSIELKKNVSQKEALYIMSMFYIRGVTI